MSRGITCEHILPFIDIPQDRRNTPTQAWVYSEEDFSPRSYSQSLLRKKVDEGALLKVGEVDVRLLFRILVKNLEPCTIEDFL